MRKCDLLIVAAAATAATGQVVNINARSDCSGAGGGVPVELDAGVYLVSPIGPPEGAFTAWNAWAGAVIGCEPSGGGCEQGWLHAYEGHTDARLLRMWTGPWSTAVRALAEARPAQLRMCETRIIRFLVPDAQCSDNTGGISLRIEPHPCPADVNVDGSLDFFDFLSFQNYFAAGDARADFDCSSALDFFDFLAFQNEFAAGC